MSPSTSRTKLSSTAPPGKDSVPQQIPPDVHDIGSVLAASLQTRWVTFAQEVERSRHSLSQRHIHDLRVASRRLRATLEIVESVHPVKSIARLRKSLKRHMRPLGLLRDLQLLRRNTRDMLAEFPHLKAFDIDLRKREQTILKRARRELSSIALEEHAQTIDRIQSEVRSLITGATVSRAATTIALGALSTAYLGACLLKSGATSGQIPRIHQFRISFKRLRYMIEALRPILLPLPESLFTRMNAYQTRMGMIQDHEVLVTSIAEWERHQKRRIDVEMRAACRTQLADQEEKLKEALLSAVEEFDEFWEMVRPRIDDNDEHGALSRPARNR